MTTHTQTEVETPQTRRVTVPVPNAIVGDPGVLAETTLGTPVAPPFMFGDGEALAFYGED